MTGNGVHSGSESQPLALRLLINSPFHTSFPSLVSLPLVSSSSSVYPFTLCLSPILTLSRSISLSLPRSEGRRYSHIYPLLWQHRSENRKERTQGGGGEGDGDVVVMVG